METCRADRARREALRAAGGRRVAVSQGFQGPAQGTIRAFPGGSPGGALVPPGGEAVGPDRDRRARQVAAAEAGPRRPGAWPWIAGLIVLALLLWGLTRLLDGGAPVAAEAVGAPPAPAAGR